MATQPAAPRPAGWYEDEQVSGRKRFWDGAAWTNHVVDAHSGAPVDMPHKRQPWNSYLAMAVLALVAVALGAFAGWSIGRNSDKPKQELAAAHRQISDDRAAAKAAIDRDQLAARAGIAREERDAQNTVDDMRGQAADARSTLRETKRKISGAQSRLSRLQSEISGVHAAIAANTVPGTGTFAVGTDIQPGTYRADASPGCYWARLNSFDTSDIKDNNNADGPVVISVLPSDAALETDGCADFHKVG